MTNKTKKKDKKKDDDSNNEKDEKNVKEAINEGSINYDNLDDILDLVYDTVYNKSTKTRKIRYETIPKHKLETSQYKRVQGETFDWKYLFDSGEIKFIGTTKNGLMFSRRSKDESRKSQCVINIGFYPKNTIDINDSKIKENVNFQIGYLLSELVMMKQTSFISCSILNFDLKLDDLKFMEGYDKIKAFDGRDNSDKIYVQISEQFFKLNNLHSFLSKKPANDTNEKDKSMVEQDWIILLFQIMHVLAKIQERYPLFRHNNFVAKSFNVYKFKHTETKPYEYYGYFFDIPIEFEVRLGNFYKSVIPDVVDNKDIKIEFTRTDPKYDLKTILNDLTKYSPPSEIVDEIKNILDNEMSAKDVLLTSKLFNKFRREKQLSRESKSGNYSNNKKNKLIYGYDSISSDSTKYNMASDGDSLFLDDDKEKSKKPEVNRLKGNRTVDAEPKSKKKSKKAKAKKTKSSLSRQKKDDSDDSDDSESESGSDSSSESESDSKKKTTLNGKKKKSDTSSSESESSSSESESESDELGRLKSKSGKNKYKKKYQKLLKALKKSGAKPKSNQSKNSLHRILGSSINTQGLPIMPGSQRPLNAAQMYEQQQQQQLMGTNDTGMYRSSFPINNPNGFFFQ